MIRVETITELVDTGLLLARQPLPGGPRVAIVGNSESLGLLTYDACLSEGLRPSPPVDLTTAATAADFHRALSGALADDSCDAVVVTAIPAVGEGPAEDAALAEALRSAAAAVPGKPVLVVHVELGGLAEALSAAMSTAPQVAAKAPGAEEGADRSRPAQGPPRRSAVEPEQSVTAMPAPEGGGLIPAFPAAERAVRALAEAVKYAQWRREATDPGRVPEFEDIDEKGAAGLIGGLLARGQGLTLGVDETCELLGRYGVDVHRALPAPTPTPPPRPPAPSATRSPSRPPPRTCDTGPTWAAYDWIWRTRTNCGGRTPSWASCSGSRRNCGRSCSGWRRAGSTPSYGPSSIRRPGPCCRSGSPEPPRSCSGTPRTG